MSSSVLSDLFYGNIDPSAKQFDRNSEFGKKAVEAVKEEDVLRDMLNGDALKRFEKILRLHGDITGMTAEGYFIEGFRTGFRIATAALYDGEKSFLEEYSEQS